MSRTLFLPLAVITAVLLAGCGGTFSGTETQAEEEGSYSGEVLSTEETCTQLRDVGGTELIEKVDAFAVEVTDKNGNVDGDMADRALELARSFDTPIMDAQPAFREHLEGVMGLPQQVSDEHTGGDPVTVQLDLDSYQSHRTAVIQECFPEADTAMQTQTPAPELKVGLITWATEVPGRCSEPTSLGITDENNSSPIASYGEAWSRIAEGETCSADILTGEENEAATYTFAWEKEKDANGNFVPRPEYLAVLHHFLGPLDEYDFDKESAMRDVAYLCISSDTEFSQGEDGRYSIERYAAAAVICPQHPQLEEWQQSIATLPDVDRKLEPFKDTVKTAAEQGRKEQQAATDKAAAEEKVERQEAREEAKNYARDGGHYLIGQSLNPGLYRSTLNMETNCYWELSDAQGNIIDNNFISTAPRFELYIPATAAGFTINGCEMRRVGD